MSWHVPCAEEVDFALDIFREVIIPALGKLEALLEIGKYYNVIVWFNPDYLLDPSDRDNAWRNDFCRY